LQFLNSNCFKTKENDEKKFLLEVKFPYSYFDFKRLLFPNRLRYNAEILIQNGMRTAGHTDSWSYSCYSWIPSIFKMAAAQCAHVYHSVGSRVPNIFILPWREVGSEGGWVRGRLDQRAVRSEGGRDRGRSGQRDVGSEGGLVRVRSGQGGWVRGRSGKREDGSKGGRIRGKSGQWEVGSEESRVKTKSDQRNVGSERGQVRGWLGQEVG
jgi:hypothetical protein